LPVTDHHPHHVRLAFADDHHSVADFGRGDQQAGARQVADQLDVHAPHIFAIARLQLQHLAHLHFQV
jgi:hypothetical protein